MARPKITKDDMPNIPQELNGIPVVSALLHQAISGGPAMATEKSLNQTKLPGIKMWMKTEGLLCHYKEIIALIPAANVACVVIDDGKH